MEKLIMYKLLKLKYRLKKEFRGFPKECCLISSQKVEKYFGFKQVFGLFIDDKEIGHDHHWNSINGEIVDLTANQFSEEIPDIYTLEEASPEAKKHYLEGVYHMF